MTSYSSVLLFNASIYNPFFTVLGLLLGAVGIGLLYGASRLLNSTGTNTSNSGKVINSVVGLVLIGGAVIVLGLAAFCAMWVAD